MKTGKVTTTVLKSNSRETPSIRHRLMPTDYLPVLLLMTVFAESLFSFMSGDFVTFTFFSTRHNKCLLNS